MRVKITEGETVVEKAKRKINPGVVVMLIGVGLFLSPIPLTYAICMPQGNPGGCGDIVFVFIPLFLLGPVVALVGLVIAVVRAVKADREAVQTKPAKPVPDFYTCALCSSESPATEKRCVKCGSLISRL